MNKNRIVVIGSTNIDMVVKTHHIPVPGETVLGGTFFMNSGGKGANQAVSISRLGGNVTLISKVGNDIFGKQAVSSLEKEGIDVSCVLTDNDAPSGVALITVDEQGENSIVVAPGSNANLTPADVEKCLRKITDADILLLQLEIPIETVVFASEYATARGMKVILNPAPANSIPLELYRLLDVITPNSNEAELLTGINVTDNSSAKRAGELLQKKGVKNVIITLGDRGAVSMLGETFQAIPARKVKAIDTTAAGDVFNGAFALAIAEGKDFNASMHFACHAAAIATTRMGAQSSIPFRKELT